MKITTKEKYSLRFLYALAKQYGKGPTPLRIISEGEEIPHKYLTQIALSLKAAGIINSIPGANGGYLLVKAPKK